MRVYMDSSALIKRVIVEQESTDLVDFLDVHYPVSYTHLTLPTNSRV